MFAQGQVVHHRAATGVEQPGTGTQCLELRRIQQMPGGMRAGAGQRGVQADHVALAQQFFQFDEIAALRCLPWRIADAHVPAQPAQHIDQPPTNLTGADHAISAFRQIRSMHLG
ncbi:hypothetical protein D3C81_1951750 [compost metagenome]